jgi:hypothetical protein
MSEEEKIENRLQFKDENQESEVPVNEPGIQSQPAGLASSPSIASDSPPEATETSSKQLLPEPETIKLPAGQVGLKPETPNMEVHHHGHVHEQKKWKEYLFQFFMLFLAVFCGFLAEYQLEHIVEHNREEQYIKSFIEDLKADTAKINKVLESTTWQQNNFDTLMGILKTPGFSENPDKAENYFASIFALYVFNHTDRTLQQLKNAGGLRLIRNQPASDSIMQYDAMIKEVSEQGEDLYNSNQSSISIALEIFDGNSFRNPVINRSLVPKTDKARLISNESAKIDEFFNLVLNFKVASVIYSYLLRDLQLYAGRQINFLKKEYHLENE